METVIYTIKIYLGEMKPKNLYREADYDTFETAVEGINTWFKSFKDRKPEFNTFDVRCKIKKGFLKPNGRI